MPAGKQSLGFRCPRCGRKHGSLRIKTVKQEQSRLTQKNMPAYIVKKYAYGQEEMIPTERNLHIHHKFETSLGISDPCRKPVVNPPEPEPEECWDAFTVMMDRFIKGPRVLLEVLPFIIEKYPKLALQFQEFADGMKVILQYFVPLLDNRWDRSWTEWEEIIKYSKAHGYNAASRRFPAIKDGKERYLSPKHIKQKTKEIDEFNRLVENNIPKAHEYLKILHDVIKTDDEIRAKYLKSIDEYDKNKEQFINQLYSRAISGKTYSYIYYYIRHYDPRRYRQRRIDYEKGLIKKSQVTGKIECGPFKEESFPNGVIAKTMLRKNEDISLYSEILFILLIQPFTGKSVHIIIGNETEDNIKSRLDELSTLGLVIQIDYSEYKKVIAKGLNGSTTDYDFNRNHSDQYYLLNWSNPLSRAIVFNYQEGLQKKKIINIVKKVEECSQQEIFDQNIYGVEELLFKIEGTRDSDCYVDILNHAKKYRESGQSPLITLIDLKNAGILHRKVLYIDAWKAIEGAGLLKKDCS